MQKSAPSIGRILIAVGFTLSCFGLLLFLWVAFGGPVPLKPKSYRITAYFPEATRSRLESDVRIGGVSVGKVKSVELAPPEEQIDGQDLPRPRSRSTPSSRRSPATRGRSCARRRCSARPTSSSPSGTKPDRASRRRAGLARGRGQQRRRRDGGGRGDPRGRHRSGSARSRTRPRSTRSSTRSTRRPGPRSSAGSRTRPIAIRAAGSDLNDALGNLGPFLDDASDVLAVLRRQSDAAQGPRPRHRHGLRRAQRARPGSSPA